MHAVTKILIAVVVGCVLVGGRTGARALASPAGADGRADRAALEALDRASGDDNRPRAAIDGEFATVHAGERVPHREFDLAYANDAPRGIWSDGATMWVGGP